MKYKDMKDGVPHLLTGWSGKQIHAPHTQYIKSEGVLYYIADGGAFEPSLMTFRDVVSAEFKEVEG